METNNPQSMQVPEASNPVMPRNSKSNKIIRIVLVIILIIIAGLGLVFLKPKNKSKQILKAANSVPYFSVASVSPDENSIGNAADSAITITFTQPVVPDTLRGYFTVSPMVPGTFSQGQTPQQVVFTPKFSFKSGTSVKVILNPGFESVSGAKFNSNYDFNFYTKPLDDAVQFENGGVFSRLTNTTPDKSIIFSLQVGSLVDSNGTISLYKGSIDQMLASLAYTNETNSGTAYISQNFINNPVDTSGFEKISTTPGLINQASYTFDQGPGLYYIEAESKGDAAGFTWVNVTNQGLLTRQDDQKITVASQDISTGSTDLPIKVSVYNLENQPKLIGSTQVLGTAQLPVAFPQVADILIGETSQGLIVVPLSVPETQSDTRVKADFSSLSKIYLYTDRPTYAAGETIQFSGTARLDNDGQYTLPPSGSTVRIWIPNPINSTKNLIDQKVVMGQGGIFFGRFTVPQELTNSSSSTSNSATLFAQMDSDLNKAQSLRSYTTFDVITKPDSGMIRISFDKSEFLKNEDITAHILGTDSSGRPLAHQQITYNEYLKNYYDADPTSVADFGTDWGAQTGSDQSVTLDDNGQANVALDKGSGQNSEAITIQANATINGDKTYGAKTVLMRQGDAVLSFGVGRKNYHSGDTTATEVYVHDLQGNLIPNDPLVYEFYTSDYNNSNNNYQETIVATGNIQTDSKGYALIQQPINIDHSLATIRVSAQDSRGNIVQSEQIYNFTSNGVAAILYYHDPTLNNLDVSTDKETYNVGDTANLIIDSPFDQNVWVTYERGRVYHNEWLHLAAGTNNYSIPILVQLAPSFNVVFSYFKSGSLNTEGLPINVTDPSKDLSVIVTSDKSSYSANDKAVVTIKTQDSLGNAVSANVSVAVLDGSIFNLRGTLPAGDIGWSYFMPRDDTTNFSASTLGIGTGEGCGGGGDDILYVPNRVGSTVYWNPGLSTASNGQKQIIIPLPSTKGNYRVLIKASTDSTAVGQSDSMLIIK